MISLEQRPMVCFSCDVYSGAGTRVARVQKENDTYDVTLAGGTKATLASYGPGSGFYVQLPLRLPEGVVRHYNPYDILRLASGGYARAT